MRSIPIRKSPPLELPGGQLAKLHTEDRGLEAVETQIEPFRQVIRAVDGVADFGRQFLLQRMHAVAAQAGARAAPDPDRVSRPSRHCLRHRSLWLPQTEDPGRTD